jgi:serine/threonine-protein kinase/endoribonuclease IRE1
MTLTFLRSFYAAFALAAAAVSLADKPEKGALSTDVGPPVRKPHFHDGRRDYGRPDDDDDDRELLDVVLVAGVDGKFHALNRLTGQTLWSMSSKHASTPALSALDPLVRTSHPEIDPDLHEGQEQYIIEPQTGDIYVLSEPSGPLQRLPFSMSKLVDISPFRFEDGGITRVFVSEKETSLLVIELETGRLLQTINSKCPWEPPSDQFSVREIDLDELEDSDTPPPTSTHIYIGRTGERIPSFSCPHLNPLIDYRVSIHTSPSPGSSIRPPVQNLSFSVYGPNNQDLTLQAAYQRTIDDTYIQSLPDGQVVSVTTRSGISHVQDRFHWRHKFPEPMYGRFFVQTYTC